MDRLRLPPTVGIVGGAMAATLVVAPYALPGATTTDVAGYYDHGVLGPWLVFVCGALAVVVFAAGRQGRAPPDTAAGAGVGLGLAMAMFGGVWALSVPLESARPVTPNWWFQYHRWAVLVVAVVVLLIGLWYELSLILNDRR